LLDEYEIWEVAAAMGVHRLEQEEPGAPPGFGDGSVIADRIKKAEQGRAASAAGDAAIRTLPLAT
jgi:hypothetical protein